MKYAMMILPALLSGCATRFSTPDEPPMQLGLHDINLDTAGGRDTLMRRVETAIRDYCAHYGTAIIPPALPKSSRTPLPQLCFQSVEAQTLSTMPAHVRHAYKQGKREQAGH